MPRDTVEFSANVLRPKYREFTDVVPVFGANTWFINSALDLFLAEVKKRPGIVEPLQNAIQRLIEETLQRNVQERNDNRLTPSSNRPVLERDRKAD